MGLKVDIAFSSRQCLALLQNVDLGEHTQWGGGGGGGHTMDGRRKTQNLFNLKPLPDLVETGMS